MNDYLSQPWLIANKCLHSSAFNYDSESSGITDTLTKSLNSTNGELKNKRSPKSLGRP